MTVAGATTTTTTSERLRRHVRWWRHEGLGRVLEEKDVRPGRLGEARARRRWRREHADRTEPARPVWVVGLQRSGTNMVMRVLAAMPEVDVCNEDDRRAFDRYRLRDDAVVADVIRRTGHAVVALKPLCDSHRVLELLDGVHVGAPGRAVWVYRSLDGRVRSATSRFGDHARRALADVAAGVGTHWQGEGLPDDTVATLAGIDWSTASPATAQAALWWARNKLVVDLGLADRPDVLVVSYDRLVVDPAAEVDRLVRFIGCDPRPSLAAGIAARRPSDLVVPDVDPAVRALAGPVAATLDELAARPA